MTTWIKTSISFWLWISISLLSFLMIVVSLVEKNIPPIVVMIFSIMIFGLAMAVPIINLCVFEKTHK
ncbi:hypothetical protein [Treponema pectinovorum]|uniref:hypothetical protein n=1 Tax=Treponema pectinovorum TaxID=164 RepID=UPI0011C8C6DF|nr:hypothetical protein [Treponema pectinovorum]